MNPLTLVPADDPFLTRPCRSDFVIDTFLIDQMFNFMVEHKGLGLAAPQVGINARLFVTRWGEVFICPRISEKSIPCTVLADGRVYTEGRAVVIQHELDHLNGVLITDIDYVM